MALAWAAIADLSAASGSAGRVLLDAPGRPPGAAGAGLPAGLRLGCHCAGETNERREESMHDGEFSSGWNCRSATRERAVETSFRAPYLRGRSASISRGPIPRIRRPRRALSQKNCPALGWAIGWDRRFERTGRNLGPQSWDAVLGRSLGTQSWDAVLGRSLGTQSWDAARQRFRQPCGFAARRLQCRRSRRPRRASSRAQA